MDRKEMSLEDKAKEYAREIMGKDIIAARYAELKDAMIMDYQSGYKQALKDMMEKLKANLRHHYTANEMYPVSADKMLDQVFEEIKQVAEDLGK